MKTSSLEKLLILIIFNFFTTSIQASGYRISASSVNSFALSAAYVANANGADAAYFNPAAMVLNEDRAMLEGNMSYIYLSPIDFAGTTNESSERQHFFIPSFHYSSEAYGNARFGFSVITPGGLTKRWRGALPKSTAEKFSLKTVELNPSIGFKIADNFSIGIGARALYSEGIVRSNANPPYAAVQATRNLTGDSWDFGYNLALLYQVNDKVKLGLTYRSNIDMTVEGEAKLVVTDLASYNGSASLEVPMPASLALASSWKVTPQTTLEVVLERNYWSKYATLDFDYALDLTNPTNFEGILAVFDSPQARNWKDSDVIRIGLTHEYDNQWTVMAGYAYDTTPAPKSTTGFELPDSNAHLFSIGGRYQMTKDINVGAAALYEHKKSRYSDASSGRFSNASALIATFGVEIKL